MSVKYWCLKGAFDLQSFRPVDLVTNSLVYMRSSTKMAVKKGAMMAVSQMSWPLVSVY